MLHNASMSKNEILTEYKFMKKENYLLKKCKGDKTPKGEPNARRKSPLLFNGDMTMFGTS